MAVEISLRPDGAVAKRSQPLAAPVPFHVVSNLLRGLNREQRSAVAHGEGPLLVIAGPGTGKTEVVTTRIAWLIATKRARPAEILALTFTDNAAQEMQARVDLLVPYGQADAHIHTFHAFGDRLLREHAFELGLAGDVRLITRPEAIVLLREHLFELGLDKYRPLGDPTRFLGALVDLFGRAKDEDITADDLVAYSRQLPTDGAAAADLAAARSELAAAYGRYQSLLAEHGLIDHGDQVWLALRLLRDRSDVREAVARNYRYLLVDEFQDVNPAQLELVNALTGYSGNVTVVGDPDQAIYAFRGAGSSNVRSFEEHHPDLRRVVLRRNYRSRKPIIQAASRVIGQLVDDGIPEQQQVAHRRAGRAARVRSIGFATPDHEADGVAAQIAESIASGLRPREFAVLARSNSEVDALARSLSVRGVPVRTQLPADFFAQPAVRPLLAFLRLVAAPDDTLELYTLATSQPYGLGGEALTNALNRGRRSHMSLWHVLSDTGVKTAPQAPAMQAGVATLVAHVRAGIALSHERTSTEVLYDFLRRSGRLERMVKSDDATEARAVARFFEIVRSRARLLRDDRVPMLVPHLDALIEAENDASETGPIDFDAVSVLTVHRAKGLEFPIVYLTGLVEGRFPSRGRPATLDLPWSEIRGGRAAETDRLDEERRLCYVAMTRARDELWLTHHVAGPGGRGHRRVSQFVTEAMDAPALAIPVASDALGQISTLGAPAERQELSEHGSPAVATVSYSQLEEYIDCPERYRLRHVVGLPSPSHHALTYGSAMHQAVAAFHLSRDRGEPLSEENLFAVFSRAWSPEGFLSREHEEARFKAGREALSRFRRDQLATTHEVVAVERPFTFKLDDLSIRGRMDRVDRTAAGTVILDYKSSDVREQSKADERARNSLQLQVYAMAHEAESGALPSEVRLHFLDSGVVGSATPDPARLEKARTKLRAAAVGIQAANFKPRPNPISCGYCPYRQICPSSAA